MDKILPQIVVFHDGLISVIPFRPKYTSLLVYFFSSFSTLLVPYSGLLVN